MVYGYYREKYYYLSIASGSQMVNTNLFTLAQPGMKQKLEQIAQELEWVERMDVTVTKEEDDEQESLKTPTTSTVSSEKSIHDDFQREMRL